MNWDTLLAAGALVLVLEGLVPFLSPGRWRQLFAQLLSLSDGQIRFMGLVSMLCGLLVLMLIGG